MEYEGQGFYRNDFGGSQWIFTWIKLGQSCQAANRLVMDHWHSADSSDDAGADEGPANPLPKPSADPAEGSSEVIDRDLLRQKKGAVTPSK
jgi:hypothetical protein